MAGKTSSDILDEIAAKVHVRRIRLSGVNGGDYEAIETDASLIRRIYLDFYNKKTNIIIMKDRYGIETKQQIHPGV